MDEQSAALPTAIVTVVGQCIALSAWTSDPDKLRLLEEASRSLLLAAGCSIDEAIGVMAEVGIRTDFTVQPFAQFVDKLRRTPPQ